MADHQAHIIQTLPGAVGEGSRSRLVIYCHYDADGLLADYVLHAVKALHAADGEVVFVTNGIGMTAERLQPLLPYIRQAVIRENRGYDFGAYYTGLMLAGDWNRYRQVILTNDSAYGPFYPLERVFQTMRERELDVWGMTDGIAHRYYVQSWFQVWENRGELFAELRRFWNGFTFEDDKEKVIERYELGLSLHLLQRGYKLGAFCPQEQALANRSRWLAEDPRYAELDAATARDLARRKKPGVWALFGKYRFRRCHWRLFDYWQRGVAIPQYSLWYPLVAKMGCPYIKVTLLRDPKLVLQHQFLYMPLLSECYPEYNIELIQQHVHRIRAMTFPKGPKP